MNKYSYELENGSVKGDFNIYQGRNGKIYLMMGHSVTPLSLNQLKDLKTDVYSLKDFDHDTFKNAYKKEVEKYVYLR